MNWLELEALTAEGFSAYGDVIECAGHDSFQINNGMADRYHALARVEVDQPDGIPIISLVTSRKYTMPHIINMVERHPLGSQAFIPLEKTPFVIIVARQTEQEGNFKLNAFMTNGEQGINYFPGTWHGLLLTPIEAMTFVCVDRSGPGENCDEFYFDKANQYLIDMI